MNEMLSLSGILNAQERIRPYIRHTPMMPLPYLTNDVPAQLRLKLENLQVTGSFKCRGVFNHLTQLDDHQRSHGIATASGGNHGIAVAYGAYKLGIPSRVFLPESATDDRVARSERWGATVVRHGKNWDDAHVEALRFAAEREIPYIHPFDTLQTVEGQGTLGLELLEDVPNVDCVLIAIGGGGLIAGTALAIKSQHPHVRIIGVEPTGAPSMTKSLHEGELRQLDSVNTIADTLSLRAVSQMTLDLTQQYVDDVVLVDDASMIQAMEWLWLNTNQLVEPAGAAVIAAVLTGKVDVSAYQAPVAVICGGNANAQGAIEFYQKAAKARGSL